MFAGQMIGHKLITKQTGAAGRDCNSVLICERKFARREFYLAVLMDRGTQGPVIVASSQGGMDIEAVAKENPEAIITTPIDIKVGVTDDIARTIATDLGFSEQCIEEAKTTIQNLYKVFMERDATQIDLTGHLDDLGELDRLLGGVLEVLHGEDLKTGLVDLNALLV